MNEQDPLQALCERRIGRVLGGKWHLDELIGVGGMAAVYSATHRNGARAAIKVLHGELLQHGEARARFLREAYIANKVEHPGTVKAIDDDVSEDGEPYLVMELLHGESIEGRAERLGGKLPMAEALWVADQTLAVLELAHAIGVVHRDLKPENLFLTEAGQLKVLDFGIARLRESAHDKRTQTGMMMGTPSYMAPEQALARWSLVDGRTDLWAVGAIIFTLLVGRCVHDGASASEILVKAATQPAPSFARVLPGAPIALVRLVDRALAFDQAQRFATANEMRAALEPLLARHGAKEAPPSRLPDPGNADEPMVVTIDDSPSLLERFPDEPLDSVDLRLDATAPSPSEAAATKLARRPAESRTSPKRPEADAGLGAKPAVEGWAKRGQSPPERPVEGVTEAERRERPDASTGPGRRRRRVIRQVRDPRREEDDEPRAAPVAERLAVPRDLGLGAARPDEPAAGRGDEPTLLRDDEPVLTLQHEPAMLRDDEPVLTLQQEPAPELGDEPELSLEDEPALTLEEEGAVGVAHRAQPAHERSWPGARPFGHVSATPAEPPPPIDPVDPGRALEAPLLDEGAREPQAIGYKRVELSPEDTRALVEAFVAIDRALVARRQYGDHHPETSRRFDRAFSAMASALMHSDDGLAWNVTPFSFVVGSETIWEPAAPLDQVPYQLFSDGLRMIALLPGLDEREFRELFRIMTLDRATEVAPEDDAVTLLWEASLDHVLSQAIDSFEEGDQEARARFARNKAQIVALAHFDTSMLVEQCWAERFPRPEGSDAAPKLRRVASMLGRTDAFHTEDAVQALALGDDLGAGTPARPGREPLRVDESTARMLAARLGLDTVATGERFIIAAARAYEAATSRGAPERVSAPICATIDGLALSAPEVALDFIARLCQETGARLEPPERARLRGTLAGSIVSRRTLEGILAGALREGADREAFVTGIRMILANLDDTHLHVVLSALPAAADEQLRAELVGYLTRVGSGHEPELGEGVATAVEDVALVLIEVLAALPGRPARDAIMRGAESPHPLVRIAALGHAEGASSERLRVELRALLRDPSAEVRLAALRAMERHKIRVAGPFLVVHIRESTFDGWSEAERRQALSTVAALAPARAEALCVQLLGETKLLASASRDKTREIAADVLGRVASTDEAFAVLRKAAGSRWWSSEGLRRACTQALELAEARRAPTAPPADSKEPRG